LAPADADVTVAPAPLSAWSGRRQRGKVHL